MIKEKIKKIIFENFVLWKLYKIFLKIKGKIYVAKNRKINIVNKGKIRIIKQIQGIGHQLIVNEGTILNDTVIHMRGSNNKIVFGKNCFLGPECSFWLEGENCVITVGDGTTFTKIVHVNVQEDNMSITIGNDCMFSNHIIIRTSDSHPIYDKNTNERLNHAKSVFIGNHVWIAPNSTVMKGVTIGDGTIIGSNTLVTKDIPSNVLVVGAPAKIAKNNIEWTREDIIFNNK